MYSFIEMIGEIIGKIYNVLDVQLFPDFPITYMQMILVSFVIVFILRFMFGGMKEVNGVENLLNANLYTRMSNDMRIKQLERKEVKNLVGVIRDKNMDIETKDLAWEILYSKGYNLNGKRVD